MKTEEIGGQRIIRNHLIEVASSAMIYYIVEILTAVKRLLRTIKTSDDSGIFEHLQLFFGVW